MNAGVEIGKKRFYYEGFAFYSANKMYSRIWKSVWQKSWLARKMLFIKSNGLSRTKQVKK